MNNEKIAPKVFPNFDKQLKDGKIPFYISNLLQNIWETSDSKGLQNRLIESSGYLEHDVKLKNIFLNFGWNEKNKNFSKEINYKELNEIIREEYEIGFAACRGEKAKIASAELINFPEKCKNKFTRDADEQVKGELGSRVTLEDLSYHVSRDFEHRSLLKIGNKNLNNNSNQMDIEAEEITDAKKEKGSGASKADLNQIENSEVNLALKTEIIEATVDSNKIENTSELEKGINEAEINCNSNLTLLNNLIKSGSKSHKALQFSSKKSLTIAGEEDFDEDSATIKKPIATTVPSNSYPFDYSKIILLQNEQIKNPIKNSINLFNNVNHSNNNEENLKMQNILVNSHPNLLMNSSINNPNYSNNLTTNVSSPNSNFNKNFNKNININNNNNKNNLNANSNNYFFGESQIGNQDEIPKIITPKFNKIIPTPTNNPLNNLNLSGNFIPNSINNNIFANINNSGIPIEANSLPMNANPNVNPYLMPNSPTMHFNSSIFTKSNFTKNASNFNCHASPGSGFGFNASSAFNANNPHLKGGVPLNSPHSVKSLDLNQAAALSNHTPNFYYFNNLKNNNFNINNLSNYNNKNNNFYNSTEEQNRKISISNAGSVNSNKVSGTNLPKIRSKNLSFYQEDEEEEENEKERKKTLKKSNNKINNFFHSKNAINKTNSVAAATNKRNLMPINVNFPNESNNVYNNNKNEIRTENQKGKFDDKNYSFCEQTICNDKNIKENKTLKNNYNNIKLEMRHKQNLLNLSCKIKEAENSEKKKILENNLNSVSECAEALESHGNPNVSVVFNEKNELLVLIDKHAFSEAAENFGLPILEKLTSDNVIAESALRTLEAGRHKRSIQRNKRFFDEEHFHFDNSFRKIVTPKNSENSGNIRNFINSNTNASITNGDIGLNQNFNGNNDSSSRSNFIKRKRKKISKLRDGDGNFKKRNNNDAKTNSKINNNTNFYEFNIGNGNPKDKKLKKSESRDKEPSSPSSAGEQEISENNNNIYKYTNNNNANNETTLIFSNTANKLSKISKLKSNRIFQSGQSNFIQSSLQKDFHNPGYNNHNFYTLSLEENQAKSQMGRRRKRRGKNQKQQLIEATKSRQNSRKHFTNSRNTSYGLKEISKNVLKIVRRSKSTTYKEISDMIVRDINADLNGTKDEKNIRRRIYDSLNVMKAMNIFKKERNLKNIVFNNTSQNAFLLSLLEKDDSSRSTPRTEQQPLKGVSLRDGLQPLKKSFFRDNYLGSTKQTPTAAYFNPSFNQVDNNFADVFESENTHNLEFQRKIEDELGSLIEAKTDEAYKETNESMKENKDSNCLLAEEKEIACSRDKDKNLYNTEFKAYVKAEHLDNKAIRSIDQNTTNNNFHRRLDKENLGTKAKEDHLEQLKFTQKQQEASLNNNQTQRLLQRKLSSESNFRPTACNSNTNINNNFTNNIFGKVVKNNPNENPLFYSNTLRASNLNFPAGVDSRFNYFPHILNPNPNFFTSGFNLNASNSLNYTLFQNNPNHSYMSGDPFYQQHARENRDDAYFNYHNQNCRNKKQMIETLKTFIDDKKRILNARLLEMNLLKYNSDLLRRLLNYNRKNAENIKEDDKIRFPFLCVEFPSYKKSEVNLVINEEKTKLYCNFEDEVNIYGDLDLIKKISKINSIEN